MCVGLICRKLTAMIIAVAFIFPHLAASQTEKIIQTFGSLTIGWAPSSGLTADSAGTFYGTTLDGGTYGYGSVYKLTPNGDGTWTGNAIYSFSGTDGSSPSGGLVFDVNGNLYGTTISGGASSLGTVYKLIPSLDGWNEQVLYSFCGGTDGAHPYASVSFDAAGNLYGTTIAGGGNSNCTQSDTSYDGCGTVFQLDIRGNEHILHSFAWNTDGAYPTGAVLVDAPGNIYGTTSGGGSVRGNSAGCAWGFGGFTSEGCGVAFELTPQQGGGWFEDIIYTFVSNGASDGCIPRAGLVADTGGHLYGATFFCGTSNLYGTIFELAQSGANWTHTTLYSFAGAADGASPTGNLTIDTYGNLYGTTSGAGINGNGTIFELAQSNGNWALNVLYDFLGRNDGSLPETNLILDSFGNLYGTTIEGGGGNCYQGCGTVFEITQAQQIATTTSVSSSLNPSAYGFPLTVSSQALPASGTGVPTGSVAFFNSGTSLGVVALSGGVAALPISTLPVGLNALTAVYSGDAAYSPSTSPVLNQQVNQATSIVVVSSSPNPSAIKQMVTFTAVVKGEYGGTPTGTITFQEGSVVIGAAQLVNTTGTLQYVFPTVGSFTISTTYSGDSRYQASNSNQLTQTVATTALTVLPSSLVFSSQTIDTTSQAQVITVSNPGTTAVGISQISSTGDFAETNTCSASLDAGARCSVSVTFTPSAVGKRTGQVTIADTTSASPQTVNLTGTSAAVSQPVVVLSCPPVSPNGCSQLNLGFGPLNRGPSTPVIPPSITQSVTVANAGTGFLTFELSTFQLAGANPNEFVLDSSASNSCSVDNQLVAGSHCVLTITFNPVALGPRGAILTVNTNDPSGPQQVALTGIGMNVFYQFGAGLSDTDVPSCFDVVPESEGQPGAGCSNPLSNTGYKTTNNGCALSSASSVMSTFSDIPAQTPESIDTTPPTNAACDGAGDTEKKGLYCPLGSGDLHYRVLPHFLEGCQVSSTNGVYAVTGCSTVANGTSLSDYLLQHVLKNGDRVVLQLYDNASPASCASGYHIVTVIGPSGDSDWELFDPGWLAANTAPNDLLSAHESGFSTQNGKCRRQFAVSGLRAFTATPTTSRLGVAAYSPIELLVTDASGSRVGNLSSGLDVAEIPGSSYFRDLPIADDVADGPALGDTTGVKTAFLAKPATGTFSVVATGTRAGPYEIAVRSVDSSGAAQIVSATGVTAQGATASYEIVYSTTPGSTTQLTRVPTGPIASLSSSNAALGKQVLGVASAAQVVTLTNTGDPALSIQSIVASGDFAVTNTCGSAVAVAQSCTISISFTPTAVGARTGTVTILDNATRKSQSISLSGTGTDFSIGVANGAATSVTVTAGQSATYNVEARSTSGFTGQVSLACQEVPPMVTCTASPTSVTVSSGAAPFVVNVHTAGQAATNHAPQRGLWSSCILLTGMLALVVIPVKRGVVFSKLRTIVVLVFFFGLTNCGSNSQISSSSSGTRPGTYTLKITGTSAAGAARSQILTLIVN